jgi:hypothetical protein
MVDMFIVAAFFVFASEAKRNFVVCSLNPYAIHMRPTYVIIKVSKFRRDSQINFCVVLFLFRMCIDTRDGRELKSFPFLRKCRFEKRVKMPH